MLQGTGSGTTKCTKCRKESSGFDLNHFALDRVSKSTVFPKLGAENSAIDRVFQAGAVEFLVSVFCHV